MKRKKIEVTQTLSKTFTVLVDEDNPDVVNALVKQHWDISSLLKILEGYLLSELHNQDTRQFRISKLLEILDSCRNWSLNNTSMAYEGNYTTVGVDGESKDAPKKCNG